MNQEQFEASEWRNETPERDRSVREFLQRYCSSPFQDRPRYDPLVELHFSGMNRRVLEEIATRQGDLKEVSVFYETGVPRQVHIVFDGKGSGHNIDIYLKGKALEDYLIFAKQGVSLPSN